MRAQLIVVLVVLIFGCDANRSGVMKRSQPALSGRSIGTSADSANAEHASHSSTSKPIPSKPVDEMNKEERNAYKVELHKAGYYDCCIEPDCSMCLYDGEECHCADKVKANDPVCGECYRGWHSGKGSIKGISPKQVKRF